MQGYLTRALVLFSLYFLSGKAGLWLAATAGGYAAPVWPPTGVAIAAIVLWGYRFAPMVWLSAFAVNFFFAGAYSMHNALLCAAIGCGNMLEALAAAVILERIFKFSPTFKRLSDVIGFIAIAVLTPAVSATIGVLSLYVGGTVHSEKIVEGWVTWWIGDALGALVTAPILLSLGLAKADTNKRWHPLFEGTSFLVVLAVFCLLAFAGVVPHQMKHFFSSFIVFSALIWCALRFSISRFFYVLGGVAVVAIAATVKGYGPLGHIPDMVQRLFLLQFFLGCGSVTMMILSSLVSERFAALELAHKREMSLLFGEKMSRLGEMSSSIAHEINNPLFTIYGITSRLKEAVKDGTADENLILEKAEKIEATARRIHKIVKSLLFFSRDAQADPFRKASLKNIVDDTIAICGEHFKSQHVELLVDSIPESMEIECRDVQIAQVLLNLLNNAHAAARSSDSHERWVRLSANKQADRIEISITDSGAGITAENQTKLFTPFFTTKTSGNGTGLGLSISKNIVASHKGDLVLDTNSRHTRFVLTLPVIQLS